MRTFNKMNTTDVKKARKESKELRKLKSNRNTFIETNESAKGQQNSEQLRCHYEDDFVYEGEC